MYGISAEKLCKSFPQNGGCPLEVLRDVNLGIKRREFVTVFGPNGCGKTTLLQILAGLSEPTSGSVSLDGEPKDSARVGFIFQDYNEALFPWRTVLGNVEFGLECLGVEESQRRKRAEAVLGEVGLLAFKDSFPYQLSGGMRQLTQIARALAYEPNHLLLDEPFSALDYHVRLEMEEKLQRAWMERRKTTVFVSHDVDEAVFLADRVVVLSKRPARVKKIIRVDLPRPRTLATRTNRKFFGIRNKVIEAFGEELL
jgi:NitT/TauT family transport system ATP-binding protein